MSDETDPAAGIGSLSQPADTSAGKQPDATAVPNEATTQLRDAWKAKLKQATNQGYGPVKEALKSALPGCKVQAISASGNDVIKRSLFSPGTADASVDVTCFCMVENGSVEMAIAQVRDALESLPFPRTAIFVDGNKDYVPTHILSTEPQIGNLAKDAYPNAELDATVRKRVFREGPWVLKLGDWDGPPAPLAFLDERDARLISPGDDVIMEDGDGQVAAVAKVSEIRRGSDGNLHAYVSHFAWIPVESPAQQGAENAEQGTSVRPADEGTVKGE